MAQHAFIYGKIKDADGHPMSNATIAVQGTTTGTQSNEAGDFELKIASQKKQLIVISHLGFMPFEIELVLKDNERFALNKLLQINTETELQGVVIEDKEIRKSTMTRIDPKLITILPSTTGGVEALIKTLPGVVSNNDLSSQYSVRGGNYDENLVYVNDVEIFRPFLVRTGQQEGLSFINGDMVSSLAFSAGGFESKYGDKMSSVLDVKYRKPYEFGGAASAGTLGGSLFVQDISKNSKWTYMLGARYKQNAYLLNSLDVKGAYKPSFTDIQSIVSYTPNEKWEFSLLSNYARNKYFIIPQSQQTEVGTVNQAIRLNVDFEGKESDIFQNGMSAFTSTYKANKQLKFKFIGSGYKSRESENYDILGAYRLSELENNFGSEDFAKEKFTLGTGGFIDHARNELNAQIYNTELKSFYDYANGQLTAGVRFQNEQITDVLNEWHYVDSSDYSLPVSTNAQVNLYEVIKSNNAINSQRITAYIQNQYNFSDTSIFSLNTGVRLNYWSYSKQVLISPRAIFTVKPKWSKDVLFRLCGGSYNQPPFYRELRNQLGKLNPDIKAQESWQIVLAGDYNLKLWSRPFKIVAETYYKWLNNLIPYQMDNVRIRYYAQNNAVGYARGIDLKINGEFVKGAESWLSVSYMQTTEDIKDDYTVAYYNAAGERIFKGYNFDQVRADSIISHPGFIPRPTDQRVNVGLFFQDYIPQFPTFKMSLNLLFGTGFPFGPPDYKRSSQIFRYPPYRRVDLGLSKMLIGEATEFSERNPLRHIKTLWLGLDVFNLLGIDNVVSYTWVRDINARQYGIPNYLTQRLINLRLIGTF